MSAPSEHASQAVSGGMRTYLSGFVASVLLTAVPFAVVMGHVLPRSQSAVLIMLMGLVQIFVHLRCFLHLDSSQAQRWNVMSFAFTALIVAILVGGSVWIMMSIGHHMMAP